jgi:ATP-dependent protease ClpP protease subunit
MSLASLPSPKAPPLASDFRISWEPSARALALWAEQPLMAEPDGSESISIFDVIGYDDWTGEGITEKRIAAALRSIGPRDVTVYINSPGGDMYTGLAIYNMLREHPRKVTVKVIGVAASAASLIAMAGDEIQMAEGSALMIHNSWSILIGNRHHFIEASRIFEQFDRSMAAIYSNRTGIPEDEMLAIMDGPSKASDGTYFMANEAVEKGFADVAILSDNAVLKGSAEHSSLPTAVMAKRRIEAALAAQGFSRKDRMALLREVQGERDAAVHNAERDAGDLSQSLSTLLASLKGDLNEHDGIRPQ